MFTSIPSEPGWTVEVDGEEVEYVELIKAFIGIPLTPGTHTVTLKYTPPGFTVGVVLLILGIGAIVMFYLYDRKNNKVLLAAARERKNAKLNKERAAQGLPPIETPETAAQKKKAAIIKSKGAPSGKTEENASEELTDAQKAAQNSQPAANSQNNTTPKKGNKKKKKKR